MPRRQRRNRGGWKRRYLEASPRVWGGGVCEGTKGDGRGWAAKGRRDVSHSTYNLLQARRSAFLPQLLPLAAIWIRQMSFGGGVPFPLSPTPPPFLKTRFCVLINCFLAGRETLRGQQTPRVFIFDEPLLRPRTRANSGWLPITTEARNTRVPRGMNERGLRRRPLFLTARGFVEVSTCTSRVLFSHYTIHCLRLYQYSSLFRYL